MLGPIDLFVLRKLRHGPVWAQSLKAAKPIVERLCRAGLAERCKNKSSSLGAAMVTLTPKGQAAIARSGV